MLLLALLMAAPIFESLEAEFEEYQRMPLTMSRPALQAKVKKCEELAAKYQPLVEGSDRALSIRAGVRFGELYLHLAESVRNVALPAKLTEDQRKIYAAELDAIALRPEEKAIDAFIRVRQIGVTSSISNEWTKRAEQYMRRLRPDTFLPDEKLRKPPVPRPASDGSAQR